MDTDNIEYKIIDFKSNKVIFHPDLILNKKLEKKFMSLMYDNDFSSMMYPPFIYESQENKYILLSRQWAYAMNLAKGIYSLACYIIKDENLINMALEYDQHEIEIITGLMIGSKRDEVNIARSTRDRRRNRSDGRTCPFCGAIIRERQGIKNKEGQYLVTCENNIKDEESKNFGKGCDFKIIITEKEKERFRRGELPTNKMLEIVPGGKCPLCGDPVYKRTVQQGNSIKVYEKCRKSYSSRAKCSYGKELSEEKEVGKEI